MAFNMRRYCCPDLIRDKNRDYNFGDIFEFISTVENRGRTIMTIFSVSSFYFWLLLGVHDNFAFSK
jgi:hypothetical protein